MRYYKFNDDFIFSDGLTYIEADDGWTLRQLTVGDGQTIASNVNHPQWGFTLPEKHVNYDDFEEVIPITQQEFDTVWNQHLSQHHQQWETAKALYPLGRRVTGAILVFYPQGVIIDLESNALGVADYARCHASAQPEWMYPKHQVKAVVAGYDEENQWIKLAEPQVLAQTTE
ncbi:MAG TPA: hypothetical protein VF719_10255 [Abditibacteriaceae bacterium]|jgi:hypothetical protein